MSYPIEHIVLIIKENHTFDNYFGRFPGANGDGNLVKAPNPPQFDPNHTHKGWLNRAKGAVRLQYDEADIPAYWQYARQFALCDNYFTDVAGPSTPNHLMLIAADSPLIDNVHKSSEQDREAPKVPFDIPSLPEALEKASLTWKNYGGYAFEYVKNLRGSDNIVPSGQFAKDAAAGTLPSVSWVYASLIQALFGDLSEHPTANITKGMEWTVQQIEAIVKGGLWDKTAVFITWDDWGGWYDHVEAPQVEAWSDGSQFRYGPRVPCLVLSPYAKPGHISHTLHSHVSLLKFCETIFGLPPVTKRDQAASDMLDCFDFKQQPLAPPQ
ncbi:MAG TPA: alkaline phosphatase family protein [Candidatus Acidoferrum sp.]|nr:alkaline phosphatase family protein [Candidatus Acidoferrum sp.]